MIFKSKKIIVAISTLAFLVGCQRRREVTCKKITITPNQKQCQVAPQKPPQLTVFVHGTRLYPRAMVRSIFHCPSGFHRAHEIKKMFLHGRIGYMLEEADLQRFPLEGFYFNCWSGNLNFQAREQAACNLYRHLKKIIKKHKKTYSQMPYIRLIGHSHGCNVILNIAKIKDQNDDLVIDQLILLAGPVQQATEHLVKDPMFKQVYSLYSRADHVQVLDPQGLYKHTKKNATHAPIFSKRRFAPHPKIKQAKIKLNGRAPTHVEFITARFMQLIPKIVDALDDWPEMDTPEANTEYLLKISTNTKKV